MAIETYGIDLGTTYSVLTRLDETGTPRVIPNNAEGKDTLASAVYFPEGGDPVVGEQAKEFRDTEKDRVIECAKRYIGREGDEGRKYEIDGVVYDPIDISAMYLKRIKAYALEQGYDVNNVVITCPAYFKDPQRAATKQAAEIAGMNVLNIVNEPTAAALAFCKDEFPENKKIMVYDLGGGTFDVSIIEFTKHQDGTAKVNVIDSMGNDQLGGQDWDRILGEMIAEKVAEEAGISVDDIEEDLELKAQITSKCEETKISLTAMPKKTVLVNCNGDKIRVNVTREEFEERTASKVQETIDFVTALLEKCNFGTSDIDIVLLVGGSTFMPMIPEAVKKIFEGQEDKVKSYEPNLAVAKGAVIAANLKMEEIIREVKEKQQSGEQIDASALPVTQEIVEEIHNTDFSEDVLSTPNMVVQEQPLTASYGVRVLNGDVFEINNLLIKGSEANSTATGEYQTRYDNQPGIVAHVFSNESTEEFIPGDIDMDKNPVPVDPELKLYHLGQLELVLPPNTPAGTPILVTFRHESAGLQVQAVNQITGESNEAFINFSSDGVKSKEEVEQAKEQMKGVNVKPELDY